MKFKKLMVTLLTAVLMVMTILPYVSFAKDLSQVIEVIPGKEPTCTEPGYLGYNLLADGSFMSGNVVFGMEDEWTSYGGGGYLSPTGHDWSDVKDPTCTEDGYERCTKCGTENTLPQLCHIYALDEDDSYAPTCVDDGLEVYRCEECGMTYAEPIPATGEHDYKLDELMSYEPNCETAGLNTYECTVCGKTYTEEIPALGGQHNYEVSYEFEGTCTEEAYTTYKCTICKNEYTVRGTMKDHNWVLTEEGDKATCTTVGHDVYECTECRGKKWVEIPATGHTKVTDVGYLPTCEEEGLSDGQHCSVCGQVLIKQSPLSRTGHDFYTTEKVITKQPTHTEKGTYTYQVLCTKCDFTSTIYEDILPVKKHIPVTDEGKAATCIEEGLTEGSHCSICGEVIVAQEVIPTTDEHKTLTLTGMNEHYEDGEFLGFKFTFTCQDCGAQKYSYVYHHGYDEGYPATCGTDGLWPLCGIVDKFGWWDEDCGAIELTRVNGVWELTNINLDNDVIPATGEHNWVTVTEPACLYKGKQKCTVCGKEEIIPPTGVHDYQLTHSHMCVEPTCEEDGYYEYKCSMCCHTYSEIVPATGHSFTNYIPDFNATCVKDGTKTAKCDYCTATDTIVDEGTATGVHTNTTTIITDVVEATCTTDRTFTSIIHCNDCDQDIEVLTGCVELGTVTGHNPQIKIDNRVPATCTEKGSLDIILYCTKCGEELSTEHIETAPTGHTEVTREENNKPATCSTNRSYDLVTYCAVCKEVISTEHKVVEGKTPHKRVVDPAVEATCTHTGLTEGQHCSVCGEVFIAQEVVEKKAHVIMGTIGCSAGCLHEGWSCKMCKNCDEEIDLVKTPALGHNYEFLKMTRTLMADYEDEIGTNYIIGGGDVLDFGSGNIYRFYRCSRCKDTYYEVIGKLNTSAPAPAVTEPETEPDDGLIRKRDTVTAPTTTVEEETTTEVEEDYEEEAVVQEEAKEAPKLNGWVHIGQKWYHYVDGVRTTTWDWYAENINEYRGVYVVNWDGQWFYLTQNNGWAEFGTNSTYDPIPEDIWF